MGKSTPQAPTPVDPTAVARAQTASNQQTAQYQSQLNNGNSYTPYGSVTQTQDPTTNQWTSTTTLSPAEQGILNSSQQAQQSALGVANQQIGRVNTALGQSLTPGQLQTNVNSGPLASNVQAGPLQYSFDPGQSVQGQVNTPSQQQAINQAEQASFGSSMGLLAPQMQQQAEHQQAQLTSQGLNPNDAAFQNSQTLFNNGQNQLLNQAANSAVAAGQNEQNTLYGQDLSTGQFANSAAAQQYAQNQGLAQFYNQTQGQQFGQGMANATLNNSAQQQLYGQGLNNANLANSAEATLFGQQAAAQQQPINEFSALLGSGQVQNPQGTGFNPVGVAPTNVTDAYALQAGQQQAQYQAQLQAQNSGLTGLFGLGSAALTKYSDARLKTDLKRIGKHASGLPLYSYRYVWDAVTRHVGVLAQDVARKRPDALLTDPSGFLMVNYMRLA